MDGNFIMYKRIFVIILLRFPCVLPMECIRVKGNFEDESFADSNITTNSPKIYIPQNLLYILYIVLWLYSTYIHYMNNDLLHVHSIRVFHFMHSHI